MHEGPAAHTDVVRTGSIVLLMMRLDDYTNQEESQSKGAGYESPAPFAKHYLPAPDAGTIWNCCVFTFSSPIQTSAR
jgi:hypothetical protein